MKERTMRATQLMSVVMILLLTACSNSDKLEKEHNQLKLEVSEKDAMHEGMMNALQHPYSGELKFAKSDVEYEAQFLQNDTWTDLDKMKVKFTPNADALPVMIRFRDDPNSSWSYAYFPKVEKKTDTQQATIMLQLSQAEWGKVTREIDSGSDTVYEWAWAYLGTDDWNSIGQFTRSFKPTGGARYRWRKVGDPFWVVEEYHYASDVLAHNAVSGWLKAFPESFRGAAGKDGANGAEGKQGPAGPQGERGWSPSNKEIADTIAVITDQAIAKLKADPAFMAAITGSGSSGGLNETQLNTAIDAKLSEFKKGMRSAVLGIVMTELGNSTTPLKMATEAEIMIALTEFFEKKDNQKFLKDNVEHWLSQHLESIRGPQGKQGERGERGERGETGPQGIQGPQGLPGAAGANGRDGLSGSGSGGITRTEIEALVKAYWDVHKSELTGPQGPKGEDGKTPTEDQIKAAITAVITANPDRFRGPQGLPGDKGERGERGETGSQGIQGPQGLPGAAGANGRDGQLGPEGKPGQRGEKGDKGDKGDQGSSGGSASFTATDALKMTLMLLKSPTVPRVKDIAEGFGQQLIGPNAEAPKDDQGNNNDLYIQLVDGEEYPLFMKVAGEWTKLRSDVRD